MMQGMTMVAGLLLSMAGNPGSPQVSRDRLLWQRTSPDFAIYLPSGYLDGTNQQVVGAVTPKGTFVVVWTTGARESAPDHRLVVSRSTDRGRTWSDPLVLDCQSYDREGQGDGHRAQYGVPFVVPATGRVYAIYNKNTGQNQVRPDITGVLTFKYSDDDGVTWQHGGVLPIAPNDFSHPDPQADPNYISLYSPIITSRGTVLMGFGRYKAGPKLTEGITYKHWQTEICFLRFDNILTETDPSKLRVTTLPKDGQGLHVPRHDDPGKVWGNEPSIIELSGGRLLTAFRTRANAIYYAVSSDEGQTWTKPLPLRYRDGGEIILNPSAPCPLCKLSDGRIVLMFYNQPMDKGPFGRRDPVFLTIGRERSGGGQPVEFGKPRQFMTVHGEMVPSGTSSPQIASYSSFVEYQDKLYLFYNDCKYFVLGKVVPPALLEPAWSE
jgi:hypothetical protein